MACMFCWIGALASLVSLQDSKTATATAAAPGEAPVRLAVIVVVDQLRCDQLTRFEPYLVDRGFKRLMREGALFVNAHFSYASSSTAPGHATIATGAVPRWHGIVANHWYRPDGQGKRASIHDDAERLITPSGASQAEGASPRQLIGSTLGDQVKLADVRGRVFSVAIKDRAAILLAGKNPDGVYWWDGDTGGVVSSTYYAKELPSYVRAFADEYDVKRWAGGSWEPLLSPEAYASAQPLVAEWNQALEKHGAGFPHAIAEGTTSEVYDAVVATPYGNELVLELAKRMVVDEQLGRGEAVDLLCVGLSSFDVAGHLYGPHSAEMIDMTLQTDRQLAAFFDFLDGHVGLDRCLMAVTGDHGVSPAPQVAHANRLAAGIINMSDVVKQLEAALRSVVPIADEPAPLISGYSFPWFYVEPAFGQWDAMLDGELTRAAKAFLESVDGVAMVMTSDELHGAAPPPDDSDRMLAWRSYYPDRAGRFFVRLQPFHYKSRKGVAGHAFGFRADRHVPILLRGPRVVAGRYFTPADPTDIAVTLSALLGIEPPAAAIGRVLHEALDTAPETPKSARR